MIDPDEISEGNVVRTPDGEVFVVRAINQSCGRRRACYVMYFGFTIDGNQTQVSTAFPTKLAESEEEYVP